MKKVMFGFAPVLAVAAFAISPASALAATSYGTCSTGTTSANCPAGEKFTEFTEFKHEEVRDKKVSTAFVLENEAGTLGIECKSFKSIGYVWNVGKVGFSEESLNYDECVPTKDLAVECSGGVNVKNNHEIQASITNEVTGAEKVKLTISEGFNVKCKTATEEVELGAMTGSVTGTQTEKAAVLKFAKAKGLTFAGESMTLTGEDETELISNGKKLYLAAAPACEVKLEKWVFCSGGDEANGTEIVKGTIGAVTLTSVANGVELEIGCAKGGFEPTLEPRGELAGTFVLEGCTVAKPAGTCKVHNGKIVTEPVGGELEGAKAGPPEVKLGVTGKWGELEIEACAAIEGKYILSGTQKCSVDPNYKTEEAEHEFKCAEAGSSLKLELKGSSKNEAAKLAMTMRGPLTSGADWSMQLN